MKGEFTQFDTQVISLKQKREILHTKDSIAKPEMQDDKITQNKSRNPCTLNPQVG